MSNNYENTSCYEGNRFYGTRNYPSVGEGNYKDTSDTITVTFNQPVYGAKLELRGKYPQRLIVTESGQAPVAVDLQSNPGYQNGGIKSYSLSGRKITEIKIKSTNPNYSFSIADLIVRRNPIDSPPVLNLPEPNFCNVSRIARPSPQNLSGHDWTMRAEVSDRDGLVLTDVRLKGRLMAEKISVPYYNIETDAVMSQQGELRPNDTSGALRSRLVSYKTEMDSERFVVRASYAIDNISFSNSCLNITQRYEFLKENVRGACEPGNSFPCNKWRAKVSYRFNGVNNEKLKSLYVAQRSHFAINEFNRNSVGLFKDCDGRPKCLYYEGRFIFADKLNPLFTEYYSQVVSNGEDAQKWDNIHQTYQGVVSEPSENLPPPNYVWGGCPECVHTHWRWDATQGALFGNGKLLLPENTDQDMSFGIARYRSGEEHPLEFTNLMNNEPIRFPLNLNGDTIDIYQSYEGSVPNEVVTWMSAAGHKSSDEFFSFYSFFNSASPNVTQSIIENPESLNNNSSKTEADGLSFVRDAPSTIIYKNLFADGATTYTEIAPNIVAQLPAGYVAYINVAYDVRTEAEVSGPHTITFNLPSVADQTTFNSLRVLHSEPDPFDSSRAIWVDRTILTPDAPAPDFTNRNISAKINHVGPFVIAKYTPLPPNTNVADLSVSIADSADPIVAGNQLTYTINVTNNGSQAATGIFFNDGLSPDALFVSASATQGTCREENATVICNLGTIAAGASVTVIVVVEPNEGMTRFPSAGKSITNTAFVRAEESDPNQSNNVATESTNALPDPNAPPSVKIISPADNAVFGKPASFSVIVSASDSDGGIGQVELFDNGVSVGNGAFIDTGKYYINVGDADYGEHSLVAIATDNGGRKAVSSPINYIVNGPAIVSLDNPTENSLFGRPANIALTATAVNSAGSIAQVQF